MTHEKEHQQAEEERRKSREEMKRKLTICWRLLLMEATKWSELF